MLILHVINKSLVRCTPARIGYYWSKYTPHKGLGVSLARSGGHGKYKDPLDPQGYFFAKDRPEEFQKMVAEASVIHCHDDMYPTQITKDPKKVLVYHAHIGDVPQRLFHNHRFKYFPAVKHACITNGYGRLFDKEEQRSRVKWGRLPDILDIWNPIMQPNPDMRLKDVFKVVFTHSNTCSPGTKINAKCPVETNEIVKGIPGVDFRMFGHVSFRQSMDVKRCADIVLDEIFSPYMHLASLEGACVAACVLVNYDDYTRKEICDYLSAPYDSFPFVKVSPSNVRQKIEYFRDHREEAIEIGRKSREWMEQYYAPETLLNKYLEFYGFKGIDGSVREGISHAGAVHGNVPGNCATSSGCDQEEWEGPPWGPVTNS